MDDPMTDPGWDTPPPRELPLVGELYFDGQTLWCGDRALTRGEYVIPGMQGRLQVWEDLDDPDD